MPTPTVVPGATPAPVDVSSFIDSITGAFGDSFSIANLAVILAAGVGIAAGLVLTWFAFRWISRKLMGALKKGKL